MAMMDNVDFLISHIRNAFVTSDDTSMSEWVITECRIQDESDLKRDSTHRYNRNNISSRSDSMSDGPSDNEIKGSMDIHPDMDFGAHRRRSNTAQRLERLKKEKRTQCKMKTIQWKDAPDTYKVDEKGHLFEKREVTLAPVLKTDPAASKENVPPETAEDRRKSVSTLTQQLKELDCHGSNPFFKYAKFDGRTAGGLPTRKLDIFLAFAPPDQQAYPMSILVTANAKAQEVVGLVCWQYTDEGRKPDIQSVAGHIDPNDFVNKFSLHMVEDDGEIDTDFPPIVPTDPVSKYGFTKFALVANAPVQPKSALVTINVPNRGFNKFQVDSMSVTMRELMDKVIKKRKMKIRPGLNYTLEKAGKSEIGKPVDLDAMLGSMNCLEFFLIRENSSRGDVESNGEEDQKMAESLMSHQYKSFIVSMVHKLRTNTEVQLGISGDKIEIDPVKGTTRLFRQKAVTYDADCVAACDVTETKSSGRAVFRLTYLNGADYKQHYFEADQTVATEIVEKVNNILELKFSPVRKEFVFTQEKKALQKRDSIKRDSSIKMGH
ncbi:target of rapamycin complex 2 subunit MAPKAP1-like [Physella acuta]|uniref:target of rapamycin complex 2 subunit MAPKAP1-like n=1 Tax=Physella acuta TaxID=109671 RepID=UPI0027DBEC40|nr:target of rapamycin complex 2 subunit MAPKAP1-like [Physella acuta]XP_059145210.1 target of rapamycin complex 2 subunit MAPKAP1-like [Physella acuta]XP_059145211.1 target of rapamycin complex 2 subunit MAPKAP1-like [Physella acuta]XP_059145212.1 target of rapamycin complex 2 subunit MAPKAP1-like [Physella acuta]XP_059145213.1 target of rapamycin complex 2 subunit MAPKAP1-like [Physella acuta]XP_059145214.1 target of rapamycin complex 2 subunit MAPKAP1-like [Physella acuta]XP_059145215.1 ta